MVQLMGMRMWNGDDDERRAFERFNAARVDVAKVSGTDYLINRAVDACAPG